MILFTPVPPELTVEHTPEQMARLDRRFAQQGRWPADPTLLVQDSAALLNAHLIVRTRHGEWRGDPLCPAPSEGLTEVAWQAALMLDSTPTVHVGAAHLTALKSWTAGVVTVFTGPSAGTAPRVARVLNLSTFIDRLELEFLLEGGLSGVPVLRAHRLEPGGRLTLWRMESPRIVRSRLGQPRLDTGEPDAGLTPGTRVERDRGFSGQASTRKVP